ncbi:hypothetical protein ACVIW0_007161 [Bradyrhizobium sp. USDA 4454]
MIDMRLAMLLTTAVALAAPPALTTAMAGPYPVPDRDGRERIPRTGTCPTGYVGKGAFCEALHQDTPHAFPVIPGKTCPPGTFRSADACKAFR